MNKDEKSFPDGCDIYPRKTNHFHEVYHIHIGNISCCNTNYTGISFPNSTTLLTTRNIIYMTITHTIMQNEPLRFVGHIYSFISHSHKTNHFILCQWKYIDTLRSLPTYNYCFVMYHMGSLHNFPYHSSYANSLYTFLGNSPLPSFNCPVRPQVNPVLTCTTLQ